MNESIPYKYCLRRVSKNNLDKKLKNCKSFKTLSLKHVLDEFRTSQEEISIFLTNDITKTDEIGILFCLSSLNVLKDFVYLVIEKTAINRRKIHIQIHEIDMPLQDCGIVHGNFCDLVFGDIDKILSIYKDIFLNKHNYAVIVKKDELIVKLNAANADGRIIFKYINSELLNSIMNNPSCSENLKENCEKEIDDRAEEYRSFFELDFSHPDSDRI